MEQFDIMLPVSQLRATCTKYAEHHPPSIMSLNMTAIEEDVIVYAAEVMLKEGGTVHHTLVRDKNGHWQVNLLEEVDFKITEELKQAIDLYESR